MFKNWKRKIISTFIGWSWSIVIEILDILEIEKWCSSEWFLFNYWNKTPYVENLWYDIMIGFNTLVNS